MNIGLDCSDDDSVIRALASSDNTRELWRGVSAEMKRDPHFIWRVIEANTDVALRLSANERKFIGLDSGGSLRFSMFVESEQLFGKSGNSFQWSDFENEGLLRFDCVARNGVMGVQGLMNLWLAPVTCGYEMAEGTRSAGQDEQWACLSFLTCPSGGPYENPKIMIFYSSSTFFDSTALEVVKIIELDWSEFAQEYAEGDEAFFISFFGFKRALEDELGADIEVLHRSSTE